MDDLPGLRSDYWFLCKQEADFLKQGFDADQNQDDSAQKLGFVAEHTAEFFAQKAGKQTNKKSSGCDNRGGYPDIGFHGAKTDSYRECVNAGSDGLYE